MKELSYLRVATVAVDTSPAVIMQNKDKIIQSIEYCHGRGAQMVLMPRLCLSAATCGDLFLDELLLDSVKKAIIEIAEFTANKDMVLVLGAPLYSKASRRIYDTAVIINNGCVAGLVAAGTDNTQGVNNADRYFCDYIDDVDYIEIDEDVMPISTNARILCRLIDFDEILSINIGFSDEDNTVNISKLKPFSCNLILGNFSAKAGMTGVIANRVKTASELTNSLCILSNASNTESTTDFVYRPANIIAVDGQIIAGNNDANEKSVIADVDITPLLTGLKLKKIRHDDSHYYSNEIGLNIGSTLKYDKADVRYPKCPYLPDNKAHRQDTLDDIIYMQSLALSKRLSAIGIDKIVLGMSGGLDSTIALLSAVNTMEYMNVDIKNIHAVMMPCFGSSSRTADNALKLCNEIKISHRIINIKESVTKHLQDINHNIDDMNVTFENAQARQRTMVLMDLANDINALVLGTSDMSEVALGFSTYNGDHMAMYGVNNSLPKTVLRELIQHWAIIYKEKKKDKIADILLDIYKTPISPELLPPDQNNEISQKTEDILGPYELHDCFLYYLMKYKYSPQMIFQIACKTFEDEYSKKDILKYLDIFYRRFFSSQFKRSCSYDAPTILGITLSPRGGLVMPSDASAILYKDEINKMLKEL